MVIKQRTKSLVLIASMIFLGSSHLYGLMPEKDKWAFVKQALITTPGKNLPEWVLRGAY